MQHRIIMAEFFLGLVFALRATVGVQGNYGSEELTVEVELPTIEMHRLQNYGGGGSQQNNVLYNGGNSGTGEDVHGRGRPHRSKEEVGMVHRDVRDEKNYTSGDDPGEDDDNEETESSEYDDNCTHPRQYFPQYNDSCDFVHAECTGKSELIDYLAFVLCDLPKAQVPKLHVFCYGALL